MPNIYNNNGRLKAALKRLGTLDITNQNKEDIRSFLHYVASYGVSVGRQAKYIYPLQNLAKWIGKDYMDATKEDIQLLVEYINTAKKGNPEPLGIEEVKKYNVENKDDRTPKYTAWSHMDYQIIIKKFWKWLHNRHIEDEEDWKTPKLVKFIKPKKPLDRKKVPGDLLNKKDIEILLKYCRTLREKALILVMYESGARIGEILNLKIKDISFINDGVHLGLNGKTSQDKKGYIGIKINDTTITYIHQREEGIKLYTKKRNSKGQLQWYPFTDLDMPQQLDDIVPPIAKFHKNNDKVLLVELGFLHPDEVNR